MSYGSHELDAVFEILENHRRRRVLAVLEARNRRLTVHDLTNELAVQESGRLITDVPGEDVREICLSLQHTHVPKLASFDLVEHDRARNVVEPTDRLGRLEPYLSIASETDADSEQQVDERGAP